MGVMPATATPENPHYERYKVALRWMGVGALAAAVGLAGETLGIKGSLGLAAAGVPVMELGVIGTGVELIHLSEPDQ